jgi:hypothetical protein
MPSVFQPANLTWNGQEIKSLSEAIFNDTFKKPEIGLFHTIVEGIKAKQQIAILGRPSLVGKKSTGCAPASAGTLVTSSEKFWNPETIAIRDETCWDDLKASFFVWSTQNGLNSADLTKSDFAQFIMEVYPDAIKEAIYRIAWYGDTAAETIANGGNLTNGTDKTFFNILNGFWKQLVTIATNDTTKRITITENAAATYATQALAAGASLTYLRNAYQNADKRLKTNPNAVFILSDTLVDNYQTYLESQVNNTTGMMYIENGIAKFMYRGIPVYRFDFLDRYTNAYFNTGAKWHQPHKLILTTKDNLQIGTESAGTLEELDMFYDKPSKKTYVDAMFKLDAKVVLDYNVMVGY